MKKKIIAYLIMGFFILLPSIYLVGIHHKPMFSPTNLTTSNSINEFISELEENLDEIRQTYGTPGIAISLISSNNTETIISGKANYWKKNPLTNESYFQLASISKSQCAFAIMRLVQNGSIDIDVPVETYLTRWSLPENGFNNNEVTIRRILCHAAGLSVSGVPGVVKQDNLLSIEEALIDADVRVIAEPGSVYMYSGGGYGILQLVIEEVTGLTYDEYLYSEIFEPLGLNETYTKWDEGISGSLAKGYGNFYFPSILSFTPFQAAASHYSTIGDLTKWCESFIYGQSVLNASLVNLMLTPQFGEEWGYALGFEWRKLGNGLSTFGHSGDNWGYHSAFRFAPTTGDGIVILTNGDKGVLLRNLLIAEWNKILGGDEYEDFFIKEQKRYRVYTIITLVFIIILISLVSIGARYKYVEIGNFDYRIKELSKRGKLIQISRIVASIVLLVGSIFLILFLGWNYGRSSYAPTNSIWTHLLVLTLLSWCIPASLFLGVKSIKKK
jgi:CubicO group peptidase (beta-lactamase class C family)